MVGFAHSLLSAFSMSHSAAPLSAWGRRCAASATRFRPEARERLAEALVAARLMVTTARPVVAVQEGGGAVRTVAVPIKKVQFLPPRAAIERMAPTLSGEAFEHRWFTPEIEAIGSVEPEPCDEENAIAASTLGFVVRDLMRCYAPARLTATIERALITAGGAILVTYGECAEDGGEHVLRRVFPASPVPDAWAIPWRAALAKRAGAINAAAA